MNVQLNDKHQNRHTHRMAEWLKTADEGFFPRLAGACMEPSPETIRINALGFAKVNASPKVDWPSIDWLSVFESLRDELKNTNVCQ